MALIKADGPARFLVDQPDEQTMRPVQRPWPRQWETWAAYQTKRCAVAE